MEKIKRIMIKLSGESISNEHGFGFDFHKVSHFADELIDLHKKGFEVGVVIGGGNIWRYRDNKDSGIDRAKSDTLGIMGTLMNASLISENIISKGYKSTVYTPDNLSVNYLARRYNIDLAREDLSKGKIVFLAGGTGSPFFTTDSAASLRAAELKCDMILKATKVDGVYDKDPKKNKDAKKFEKISFKKCIELGLEIMDSTAFGLCIDSGIKIMVFDMSQNHSLLRAANEDFSVGTLIFRE